MNFSNYDYWLTRQQEEDEPTLVELEERAEREEQRGFDQFEAEHQGDYDYA